MKLRRRSLSHGQSLVEFALTSLLMIPLMFILVELGIIFSVYIGLTNSAREGARAGSFYQYPYPRTGAPLSAQMASDCPLPSPLPTTPSDTLIDCERRVVIDTQITETLNAIIDDGSLTRTYTYPEALRAANNYRYGDKVVVTLSYSHDLFFNLLSSNPITLRASSTMKLEPGGL